MSSKDFRSNEKKLRKLDRDSIEISKNRFKKAPKKDQYFKNLTKKY